MRIISRQNLPANYQDTKTLQTWGQMLGLKPQYLQPVSLMKPQYSLLWHTRGLGNVHSDGKQKFQGLKGATGLDSLRYEWRIDSTNQYVFELAETCVADGFNGSTFELVFNVKWYHQGDTIMLKNRQIVSVVAPVRKVRNDRFVYTCQLDTNDFTDRITDPSALVKGALTQWVSNYDHELSSKGRPVTERESYELHRNWISAHRITETWSGDFLRQKEFYYKTPKGSENGRDSFEYFKMMDSEKKATEEMMTLINNSLMFSRTNMDKDGNCTQKSDEGYDIIKGDGLIPQIERVCDKRAYSGRLTVQILQEAMMSVAERSGKYGGGVNITFFCNQKMWADVQNLLLTEVKNANPIAPFFFAPTKAGEVKPFSMEGVGKPFGNPDILTVGATFNCYNWAGNMVKFVVDASLSTHIGYKDRPYGIFLNTGLTDDGQANISLYTVKGGELIVGDLNGLGGQTGTSSGQMATPIHGARRDWKSYSSLRVAVPYHAFILEQARQS